jgi:glutamate formiminotransferase / 5-formyltetrahydrofolate cyclo-ligase
LKVLMSVTNISEGKNHELINAIADEIKAIQGVKLLEVSTDKDHNRSVFSYLGEPEQVLMATQSLSDLALEHIDMTRHSGDHPRMGAVDVVPFIPIRNITTAEAVQIAYRFGSYLGKKAVPVYYYEDAARKKEWSSLVNIRKGQYEALENKLADAAWAPDDGPAQFNPKAGATAVGVRMPLVAFNINLKTNDINIANNIAKSIRFLNGGYRFVRAIGVTLSDLGMVQVSMNLTNYRNTPLHRVLETVRFEASRYGVSIASAELVGPVPLEALEEMVKYYLQVHDFSVDQIIETNLLEG